MTENTTISYTDYLGERIDRDKAEVDYLLHDLGRVVAADAGKWIYEYHLTDHLGNVRVAFADLDEDGDAEMLQENHYYPFGQRLNLPGYQSSDANPYLYNGKELQEDLGLRWYDYGHRFYDASIARFTTQDWYSENFAEWSPYHYANNNPILNIDIMGDSTFVSMGENGTYTVTGGNLDNKDDKGVYMMGEDGTYTQVGNSVSSHSFFDDDGNAVVGAVIDPSSSAGQDFVDGLVEDNPGLVEYMVNATRGEKYDFKEQGIDDRAEGTTKQQHRYRGSTNDKGEFGSARDYGNMGAGIVAGRKGLSWGTARAGFDGYQSYSSGKLTREGQTTQKAERVGYNKGRAMYVKEELSRLPGNGHLRK